VTASIASKRQPAFNARLAARDARSPAVGRLSWFGEVAIDPDDRALVGDVELDKADS
jgi:hypothetical protein